MANIICPILGEAVASRVCDRACYLCGKGDLDSRPVSFMAFVSPKAHSGSL